MAPLINALIQFAVLVGSIYIIGFIISFINASFYRIVGESNVTCHITGFIGTPIHELSHALFCVIFFHKIEEIKLFQINSEDGTLGYVKHSYNRKNIYQVIGNFFIGVAPILVGTFVLVLLMRYMVPNVFASEMNVINSFLNNNVALDLSLYFGLALDVVKVFFTGASYGMWWVYLVLLLCIALHMNFSKPDFRGSLGALPFILLIYVIVNAALGYIFKSYYPAYINLIWTFYTYLIVMLFLSLLFSLFNLLIALIIRLIMRIVARR